MLLTLVDRWATSSQHRSRRNAMIASTHLTQRRAEARDVEDYLDSLRRRPEPGPVPAREAAGR